MDHMRASRQRECKREGKGKDGKEKSRGDKKRGDYKGKEKLKKTYQAIFWPFMMGMLKVGGAVPHTASAADEYETGAGTGETWCPEKAALAGWKQGDRGSCGPYRVVASSGSGALD
jgi:hypothetical protein